jgi:hypothetical protein
MNIVVKIVLLLKKKSIVSMVRLRFLDKVAGRMQEERVSNRDYRSTAVTELLPPNSVPCLLGFFVILPFLRVQ